MQCRVKRWCSHCLFSKWGNNYIKLPSPYPIIIIFILTLIHPQNTTQAQWFSLPTYWETHGNGVGFNIESFDLNRDNNKDIFVSNFNTTNVFYGGPGILDDTADVTYIGKCLAICDFNGDGFDDLIAMHFTNYDSVNEDYNGNMLFYFGNDTNNIAIDTSSDYSIPIPTIYPHGWNFGIGLLKFGTQSGDVNQDGLDDLVISEPDFRDSNGTRVGKIYVYLGNEIPSNLPSFSIAGVLNLLEGIYITGVGEYYEVGDLNGDGIEDVLFSAEQTTSPPNPSDSLEILYIYYGGNEFNFQLGNESIKYESRVDRQAQWSEWFRRNFSLDDINGDSIEDLVIGGIGLPDQTTNVHYGSSNLLDTIPSFQITDPDTSDPTIWAGGISYNIGDFNNDSYDDFLLSLSGFKTFTLHFGGPNVSNKNRYGLRGLLEANSFFPQKAINVGDQNGDGLNDFAVNSSAFNDDRLGYVIMMLGRDIPVSIKDESNLNHPEDFNLFQNYPNPFNPTTTIRYSIPESTIPLLGGIKRESIPITLIVYDVLGNEITTLVNEKKTAGNYEIEFQAKDLPSGIYFYTLNALIYKETKKMILLK